MQEHCDDDDGDEEILKYYRDAEYNDGRIAIGRVSDIPV